MCFTNDFVNVRIGVCFSVLDFIYPLVYVGICNPILRRLFSRTVTQLFIPFKEVFDTWFSD
jgi:hypothetical protein